MSSGSLNISVQRRDGSWLTPMKLSGIQFTKTAPGGNMSAAATLTDAQWIDGIGQGSIVQISQCKTGKIVFTGLLKADGLVVNGATTTMTLDISGTSELLAEVEALLPYAVSNLDKWTPDDSSSGFIQSVNYDKVTSISGAKATFTASNKNDSILLLTLPAWNTIPAFAHAGYRLSVFADCGFTIAGSAGRMATSINTLYAGFSITLYSSENVNAGGVSYGTLYNTLSSGVSYGFQSFYNSAAWGDIPGATWTQQPANSNMMYIEFYNQNRSSNMGSLVDTDGRWLGFSDLTVFGQVYDRNGSPANWNPASNDANGGWLAHHIVEDLIYRLLPWATKDDQRSYVDKSSTVLIANMDYSDSPVTAQQVLDDLMLANPDHYYYVGNGSRIGDIGLSWKLWPTTPRFQAPPYTVVYDAVGSQQDLVNVIHGSYQLTNGVTKYATASALTDPATYPEANALGRKKEMWVDLGGNVNQPAQAQNVVNSYLPQVATLAKSATATISTLILDSTSGGMIEPSAIEPGYLMHVPETGEDLRITEVSYDDDSYTATVKLASPQLGLDQLLAGVGQKHSSRRR